jgi:hypothetical protein
MVQQELRLFKLHRKGLRLKKSHNWIRGLGTSLNYYKLNLKRILLQFPVLALPEVWGLVRWLF